VGDHEFVHYCSICEISDLAFGLINAVHAGGKQPSRFSHTSTPAWLSVDQSTEARGVPTGT